MTKREMMIKAHGIAKQMVGNYSARLSLALRQVWASLKVIVKNVKCNFKGVDCTVNIETGAIIGNLYSVKSDLKRRCHVSWDAVNKNWVLVAGEKISQQSMIQAFINKNAI